MLGRIRAEQQLLFLNTGLLYGVQSYSVDNNFGDLGVEYMGIGYKQKNESVNSVQYADLSIQSYLIEQDYFLSQTGTLPINFFIITEGNYNAPYSLQSGYLTQYSCKYAPNTIPEINSTFRFYGNAGNIPVNNLDANSYIQLQELSGTPFPSFNSLIGNTNYINLTLNESTGNRVLDFNLNIEIEREPVYNIGNRIPSRVDLIYPMNVGLEISFESDNYFSDTILTDFPINKTQQFIEIDTYSSLSNQPMGYYKFYNMTLVSNKRQLTTDGNLTLTRKYIGQIFSFTNEVTVSGIVVGIWDWLYVTGVPVVFIDWGSVNSVPTGGYDFGFV